MDVTLHRLVEIPKGTRDKYERDNALPIREESRARFRETRS